MLTIHEKAMIQELLKANVRVAEIADRTGRSVGTIYNLKTKLSKGDLQDYSLLAEKSRIHTSSTYKRSTRIETEPGEQAQVDWGSFGKITIDGRVERLYAFVYVLSYSRALYVEFAIRQNQQTLQECHIHAFKNLGVPKTIRYDNMKTVVLSNKRRGKSARDIVYNPAFKDFARYYGFEIDVCPPYWPRAKGKVEAGVKYVRYNFMEDKVFGKTFNSLQELNGLVKEWVANTAQRRKHGTTGLVPQEQWELEKKNLTFVTGPSYQIAPFLKRHSTKDGMVQYKSVWYSLPMLYAQKKVFIREKNNGGDAQLEIYKNDVLVAQHRVSPDKGAWIVAEEHVDSSKLKSVHTKKKRELKEIERPRITLDPRPLSYYNQFIPQ